MKGLQAAHLICLIGNWEWWMSFGTYCYKAFPGYHNLPRIHRPLAIEKRQNSGLGDWNQSYFLIPSGHPCRCHRRSSQLQNSSKEGRKKDPEAFPGHRNSVSILCFCLKISHFAWFTPGLSVSISSPQPRRAQLVCQRV